MSNHLVSSVSTMNHFSLSTEYNCEQHDDPQTLAEEYVQVEATFQTSKFNVENTATIQVPKSTLQYKLKPSVIECESGNITLLNAEDPLFYKERRLTKPSLTVWVLISAFNMLYSQKRLFEEAWNSNIQIMFMEIPKFEIVTAQLNQNGIQYEGSSVELPDVVIPRLGAKIDYFGMAVVRHLERSNTIVLNTSDSIEISKDKLFTMQHLSSFGFPIPKTMPVKFPMDVEAIGKQFSFPMILKKSSGSQGKGVMLINDKTQLSDLSDMISPDKPMIFQEFITESTGTDIRVIVIGGKAVGAMMRKAKEGFKANFHQGGNVEKIVLTQQLEWLAVETAKLCGLDIAGVDILIAKDSYKICEINSSPGFQGFEQATGINVARAILSFCESQSMGKPYRKEGQEGKKPIVIPAESEILLRGKTTSEDGLRED